MGVRDALRMIDSFVRWSKRNSDRAKPLEQFIADGLIASAKRCKSCLSRELGVTFIEDQDEQEIDVDGTEFSDEVPIQIDEPITEADLEFEETPLSDAMGYSRPEDSSEELAEPDSEPISVIDEPEIPDIPEHGITIDEFTSSSDEGIDDLEHDSEPRDFSSDFEVAEPEPLVIEAYSSEAELPPEPEIPPSEEEVESELGDTPPAPPTESSFTWHEYEETMTPDESEELEPSSPPPETREEPTTWSPHEDSIAEEVEIEEEEEEVKDVEGESPPSPPPPESDESEEERRRRARRLFFGT